MNKHVSISAAAFAALIAWSAPAAASPELRVDGRHFKDAEGRVVVLRGVNVAGDAKVPPFTPVTSPSFFDPLKAWGLNVVRLLFTWEAYEPAPGQHDEAYLRYIEDAARWAWERGLYVIIDVHQDAFSRFSIGGCGDGFPRWALPPSVTPATPDNGPSCADWGLKMLSDADMHASWDSFHADTTGARTRYLAMVASVARRLDALPGVIGYDMMNEPWGDEPTQISSLYEDAAAAIREVSPTAILFVSPTAITSGGQQTTLPRPMFGNAAYSPHFYDVNVLLFGGWSGSEPQGAFDNMTGKAEEWGVPLFLGEFGGPAGAEKIGDYVDVLYRRLDAGFFSGAQWVYTPGWTDEAKDGWNGEDLSIVDDQGNIRASFRPRPFPRKVAGVPVSFRIVGDAAPADAAVEMSWENDPGTGATELFVPAEELFGTSDVAVETIGEGLSCAAAVPLVTCSSPAHGTMSVRVMVGPPAQAQAPSLDAVGSRSCGLVGIEVLLLLPLARARRAKRAWQRQRARH